MIGAHYTELIDMDEADDLRQLFADFIEQGYVVEQGVTREVLSTGAVAYLENTAQGIVQDGYFTRVWGFFRDVTEKIATDEQIKLSEQRLRSLLEQTSDCIYCFEYQPPIPLDASKEEQIQGLYDGTLVECNEAFARIYGFDSIDEVMGKRFEEIAFERSTTNREMQDAMFAAFLDNGCRIVDGEAEFALKGEESRTFHCNAYSVIEQGTQLRTWGTSRDITEQKRLTSQLQQSQKMEAIGTLAGGIAHDFNNLMTVITGHAELIQDAASSAAIHSSACHILEAGDQAADLTRQLMGLSRREHSRSGSCDAGPTLHAIVAMVRRVLPSSIAIESTLGGESCLLPLTESELQQIVLNLVLNSRDAMPDGGTITIAFDLQSETPDCILRIADSGEGISAQALERVCEPFFTTKPKGQGTGLGLAMVYSIVQQAGGELRIESSPNQGTEVIVSLPQAVPGQRGPERKGEAADGSRSLAACRTLVVDDNEGIADLVRNVLASENASADACANAEHALQLLKSSDFDLIISDVDLPGRSGMKFTEQLRAEGIDTPVLLISGFASADDLADDLSQLDAHFLAKPFNSRQLVDASLRALNRSS